MSVRVRHDQVLSSPVIRSVHTNTLAREQLGLVNTVHLCKMGQHYLVFEKAGVECARMQRLEISLR